GAAERGAEHHQRPLAALPDQRARTQPGALMAFGLDIPLGGATAAATRAPAFDVAIGSGAWADHVVSITVEAGIAPAVGAAEIVFGAGEGAPEPAVGDSGSVALGYADASTETVFTGT